MMYGNMMTGLGWWGPAGLFGLGLVGMTIIALLALAVIVLKGYALWTAARRDERGWFVALLLINTIGILEIVYLIFVAKKLDTPHKHESHHHNNESKS